MGTDPRLLQSLGFYLGLLLLIGQFAARVALAVPFDTLFLGITGILIFGPMFGPDFVVAVIRAVRGSSGPNDRSSTDDP
jgi:hypothetical protein